MKVYLDDIRSTPDGWVRTYSVDETIQLLKSGKVEELSLDNDLGGGVREGWEVMAWLEGEVVVNGLTPPHRFTFHTDNTVRRDYMKAAARNILNHVRNLPK